MKPVKLSVHRNNRAQKERQRVRNAFREDTKSIVRGEIDGYAIVTWTKDWDGEAIWHCGGTMPGDVMPEFVKRVIQRATGIRDARNAVWEPPEDSS